MQKHFIACDKSIHYTLIKYLDVDLSKILEFCTQNVNFNLHNNPEFFFI